MRPSILFLETALVLGALGAPPAPRPGPAPAPAPAPAPPAPPAPPPPPPAPPAAAGPAGPDSNDPPPVFATVTPKLPPSPSQSPPPPPPFEPLPEAKGRVSIDPALWETLKHYGEFTTTAIRGTCWPAPHGTRGLRFIDTTFGSMQVAIFRDTRKKEIIVSFPGTNGFRDDLRNYNIFGGKDWEAAGIKCGPSCKVHPGFLNGWTSVQDEVLDIVKKETENNSNGYKVVVTGHSQGGAIGTIAYASLKELGYDTRAYVTASPQFGNEWAATYVEKLSGGPDQTRLGSFLRITAGNDGVPNNGILNFLKFTHPRPEIWLAPRLEHQQNAQNTYRCFGRTSMTCNTGDLPHDGETHSEYAFVSDDYYCEDGKLVPWV